MINPFHNFLHKQIPVLMFLSLFPGLGYIGLGWLYGNVYPALIWYIMILVSSVYGYFVYKRYDLTAFDSSLLQKNYSSMRYFYYSQFVLWAIIFVLYTITKIYELHYIAIFTQLGASVVATVLLASDKKLYYPIIALMIIPLSIYFFIIGTWYGYVLCIFSLIFMGVLFYGATSSYNLLIKTHFQANHDSLTGIKNRHYVIEFLQKVINKISKSGNFSFILLIDLDHFKTINDSLGHDIGDSLLIDVTKRMQSIANNENTLGRLGGDEFIVIGSEYNSEKDALKQAMACADKLLQKIKTHYKIEQNYLSISASIGVSVISDKCDEASVFIKEADIAMYEAKERGRNGILVFNEDMSKRVQQHLEIERYLHFALQNSEIQLNYQPQCNKEHKIVGCEVLMRWNSKELGAVSPADFIPIAEQTGIIIELGHYTLQESFKTLAKWDKNAIELEQFSVNISIRQMFHPNFIDDVISLSEKYLNPSLCSKLIFEITESMIADNIDMVISIMQTLKQIGIRFSMDDFGTGYSSLSYLKQLPMYELKIDRSFVSNLENSSDDREMISIIKEIARRFNLSIVAEGAETSKQMQYLFDEGCDIVQGYFFSKPKTKEEFEQFYITSSNLKKI